MILIQLICQLRVNIALYKRHCHATTRFCPILRISTTLAAIRGLRAAGDRGVGASVPIPTTPGFGLPSVVGPLPLAPSKRIHNIAADPLCVRRPHRQHAERIALRDPVYGVGSRRHRLEFGERRRAYLKPKTNCPRSDLCRRAGGLPFLQWRKPAIRRPLSPRRDGRRPRLSGCPCNRCCRRQKGSSARDWQNPRCPNAFGTSPLHSMI